MLFKHSLVLLGLASANSPCYDEFGAAQACSSDFQNIVSGKLFDASSTCGQVASETFFKHKRHGQFAENKVYTCNTRGSVENHDASRLTDNSTATWWQSESIYSSRKYGRDIRDNDVTLTLDLHKNYEVTAMILNFTSLRPESMVIEKFQNGKWSAMQYYSSSCLRTFDQVSDDYVRAEMPQMAICSSKFTSTSPIQNGKILFAILEGRPGATNFKYDAQLQDFSTVQKLRFRFVRLNTFGDEIFSNPKALRSYYYTVSEIFVMGRCKCNFHASQCLPDSNGVDQCQCEHNTTGPDCNMCKPLYNNKPWARATPEDAAECEKCECNGLADECVYDETLGHGRCLNCQDNTAGPKCEECAKDHFRDPSTGRCVPCNCSEDGANSSQCDAAGKCSCKFGVEGDQCDRCKPQFFGLSRGGCQSCQCNSAGCVENTPSCDPITGQCACKDNVAGQKCDKCKNGYMGANVENEPDEENTDGCIKCFCYKHSNQCTPATDFVKKDIVEPFADKTITGWSDLNGNDVDYDDISGGVISEDGFVTTSEKFTGNQRKSYNEFLTMEVHLGDELDAIDNAKVTITGTDEFGTQIEVSKEVPLSQTTDEQLISVKVNEKEFNPQLTDEEFITMLDNIETIAVDVPGRPCLSKVSLGSATNDFDQSGDQASHVEKCFDPKYENSSLDKCAPGFTRSPVKKFVKDQYNPCVPCECNGHALEPCDPDTGVCKCLHNTKGDRCEECANGFFGNALDGTKSDCQKCPCPEGATCAQTKAIAEGGSVDDDVTCFDCPAGSTGNRCEKCQTDYFGDPLNGRPCQKCNCNGNMEPGVPGNCDGITGECKKCLHNTKGYNCQVCELGTYGNPLASIQDQGWKGCKDCGCNPDGTQAGEDNCFQDDGQCKCKNGVGGKQCDTCLKGFYGHGEEEGCLECGCDALGSVDDQCDDRGVCTCQPGIYGAKCDSCMPGFYGLSAEGCKPCECSPDGSLDAQCDEDGMCLCKEGVEGDKCDKCARNHFYEKDQGCKKCDDCYNLVEFEYNKHQDELNRLRRAAETIQSSPSMLRSDGEFDQALSNLQRDSEDLEDKAEEILSDYKQMIQELSDAGQSAQDVQLKLDQFASSLESCENSVSASKEKQEATKGTIKTLENEIVKIEENIVATSDDLDAIQTIADAQELKNEELRKLAEKSSKFIEEIQAKSEEVQEKAQQARETAQNAKDEMENSMKKLAKLKKDLEMIRSDDVKATTERIIEAKRKAQAARDEAKAAKQRAVELYEKIKSDVRIPNIGDLFDKQDVKEKAQLIKEEAADLQKKVDHLMNQFEAKKDDLGESVELAMAEYEKGREYLNKADRLLAQLDGAKHDSQNSKALIDELTAKAERLIQDLRKVVATAGDMEDFDSTQIASLDELQSRVKLAEDLHENLKDNVQLIYTEAEKANEGAQKLKDSSIQAFEDAETNKDKAEKILQGVQDAIKDVESKTGMSDEIQSAFTAKEKEIDEAKRESDRVLKMAQGAEQQVIDSKEDLDEIKKLVEEIKTRKLPEIVDRIGSLVAEENYAVKTSDIQAELEALARKFADIKKHQQGQIDIVTQQLADDERNLSSLTDKKQKLQEEVDNLERISKLLPDWCSGSPSSSNENP